MRKHGDERDCNRRHRYVSDLQDEKLYQKNGTLPSANAKWPTCLIIAVRLTSLFLISLTTPLVIQQPSTVVGNWEREFETVRSDTDNCLFPLIAPLSSGVISKSAFTTAPRNSERRFWKISGWADWTLVRQALLRFSPLCQFLINNSCDIIWTRPSRHRALRWTLLVLGNRRRGPSSQKPDFRNNQSSPSI